MNKKSTDILIRIIFYGAIIIGFTVYFAYEPVINSINISTAENCYNNKNYSCAFKAYRTAFKSGIDNSNYVRNYFNTLGKIKKIAVVQEELNNLLINYPNSSVSSEIEDIFHVLKLQIRQQFSGTYIDNVVQGTNVIHWNNTSGDILVYIENTNRVPDFYTKEVKKAFEEYHNALPKVFNFSYTNNIDEANIIISFQNSISGGQCSSANCNQVLGLTENETDGEILKKSTIKLRTKDTDNTEFTANQIHNITKHEIGHALGISGHSYSPNDVMYPVSNDATWTENTQSLLIKRKEFSYADIKTLELLYKIIPDITNKPYDVIKYSDMYFPIAVLGTKQEIGEKKLQESKRYASTVDSNFVSQINLAEGYFSSKNYAQAKEAFIKAEAMAKTNEEKFTVYNNLAVVAYQEKDYNAAIENALAAQSYSDDESAETILVYSYIELNKYKEAQKTLERLISSHSDNASYSALLVEIYLKQYQIFKMLGEMKRIKKANPKAFSDPMYKPYKFFTNFV